MKDGHPGVTLRRFFAGLAENTFHGQLGVADPPLVDYLTDLLTRFVRNDSVHGVRSPGGRRLLALGDMLIEAESRVGTARRAIHRHIGDFALFWAGLYPEALRRCGGLRDDGYRDYCLHGKRAYFVASTIEGDDQQAAPTQILVRLSEHFEMCAYGLREVRREWERGDDGEGPVLLN